MLNVRMLDTQCWMADVGCWILDAGCWRSSIGLWMWGSLGVQFWILDSGCWMLVVLGAGNLDAGPSCWVWGVGWLHRSWMMCLDIGFGIFDVACVGCSWMLAVG